MLFSKWMERTVAHYYSTQVNTIGCDFITSPEISQMFGELIALFLINYWRKLHSPLIHLVELGPGRGTLMYDILRVAKKFPDFFEFLTLHLVEKSRLLRMMQQKRLNDIKIVNYYDSWYDIKISGSFFIIANEFFDSLPVQPFVFQDGYFFACDHVLCPMYSMKFTPENIGFDQVELEKVLPILQNGQYVEVCLLARTLIKDIGQFLQKNNGLLLLIDYGYITWPIGHTVQALKNGTPVSLSEKNIDVTAHVDFGALYRILQSVCNVWPIMGQGDFLRFLGIDCLAKKYGQWKEAVRLIAPSSMGNLFKVMIATGSDINPL